MENSATALFVSDYLQNSLALRKKPVGYHCVIGSFTGRRNTGVALFLGFKIRLIISVASAPQCTYFV